MSSKAYALARAALIRTLTAYAGITSADGAADGSTLVDTNLIDNAFISPSGIPEKAVLIMSGDARGEDKGASSFSNVTGTITFQGTGFSAQIKAGTIYRILNISSVEIDVANIDTKVGTNVDAAGTTTLFAWLLKIFEQGGQGLVYYGEVTTYTDTTHFRVAGLTGFGDDYFANNYRVYPVWITGGTGAAPQGEMQPCTDYDDADGIFTHTAFTAPLQVGDKVLLIFERLAEIADLLADVGDASASTLGSLYAILGNPAQTFLAMIGYEGATSLAAKITAARAGYLDELDFDLQGTLTTIAAYIDTEIATIDTKVDNILLDTQIRTIASGSKTIASGVTKYLSIDSGTNGAEIIAIIIKGIVSADWTLELYVPTDDAVASPAAGDKRNKVTYAAAQVEGGLLDAFGIAYNCFFDFTNDSDASDDVDDVVIVYRSRGALTLSWEV